MIRALVSKNLHQMIIGEQAPHWQLRLAYAAGYAVGTINRWIRGLKSA
jgi:hypothetical protein